MYVSNVNPFTAFIEGKDITVRKGRGPAARRLPVIGNANFETTSRLNIDVLLEILEIVGSPRLT